MAKSKEEKSRNDITQNPNELAVLFDLPSEIVKAIPTFVAPEEEAKTMVGISNSCTTLHTFFQPETDKLAAKQLLMYVLQGNAAKAKAMYTVNLKILFMELHCADHFHNSSAVFTSNH